MTRQHFRAILLVAIVGLVALFASASSLQAQNQKCCTYTVVVKGITDDCLPIKVLTAWDNGGVDVFGVFKDGVYVQAVPGKCPPPPSFKGVSLDGGATYVGLDQTGKFVIGKCCYLVSVTLDNNSCVEITITPC